MKKMMLVLPSLAAISPMMITGCENFGDTKPPEPVAAVRKMVETVQAAVAQTCLTLDAKNAGVKDATKKIDMRSATLTLQTTESRESGGELTLFVVSGKSTRKTTNGDSLEINIGRNDAKGAYAALGKDSCKAPGNDAEHIACLALAAVDGTKGLTDPLTLDGFTVAIDFAVESTKGGGLQLEFTNVKAGASSSKTISNGHQLKLSFGPPPKKES